MVAFIQNRNLELYLKQTLKFFNSTKMDCVFAGLNLNIFFLKKREKNAPFMDVALKTRGIT